MRRKLSKLMAYLLTFCMLMSLMPATAFAIPATHSHAICGAAHTDIGDHTGSCEDITWTAWNGTDAKPFVGGIQLEAGNYYLTGNLTINNTIRISGTVNLCLNGHTITNGTNSTYNVIEVSSGATLNICDCSEEEAGSIISNSADTFGEAINNFYGTVNVYGGSISATGNIGNGIDNDDGTVNVYGGSISAATGNLYYGIYNSHGTVNVHGGSISATDDCYYGIYNNGSATVSGGTVSGSNNGIHNSSGTSLTVSGNADIIGGNYGISNYHGNLQLSGAPTINGEIADIHLEYSTTPTIDIVGVLTNTEKYTVTTYQKPATDTPVVLTSAVDEGNAAKFESANSDYQVIYEDGALKLAVKPTHTDHPVCGKTCTHDTTHETTTWTAWESTTSLPSAANNYYLTADVTISSRWEPANGTVLCLNGHTITMSGNNDVIKVGSDKTFTLTDCGATGTIAHASGAAGRGASVYGGTFNMYGGSITGNSAEYGGGVLMNTGTFNMYGGDITGNTATADHLGGGGVYVDYGTFNMYAGDITGNNATGKGGGVFMNTGTFNMYGGDITDNSAAEKGGGVYVYSSTFTVSGSPKIIDNTKGDADNNLHLGSGMRVTVGGVLSEEAQIGITIQASGGGTFTSDWISHMSSVEDTDISKYFTSDSNGFTIQKGTNDLKLVSAVVSVTGVTLDKNSINLYLGKTDNATLTASVEPDNATNKAVTWTTDDMAVATVDQNGVVTAVGKGYTKITATAADGSGVSDSLDVYVNDKIESVVINVVAPVVGNTINGNNFSVDASQPYNIHRTSWNETLNNDDTNVTVEAGHNYKMKVVLAGNYGYFDDNTTASIKVGDDIIKEGVVLTAGATPSTCSVEYIFNIPALEYTVTFNPNGGSGNMANQTIEVGTETALSPTSFTRSGYKFSGWATSADGAKVYDDKQSVTDIAAAGESITLFAVWTEKATITISDVQQQYDYTGEPIEFNLNSPLTGFTVKYRVKDTTTWSDSVPTEVNIYDVKITRAEDADYKAYEMTFFGKLVINKAVVNVPTVASKVYTGENQTADIPESDLYIETSNEGRTTVGTANVVLTLVDSANYKWSDGTETATKTIEFEITKATPTYTAPENLTATYGETLVDVTLPAGWSWKDSNLSVGNAGTHEFTAVFTPQDTTNFEVVEINVSVAVGKTIPSYDIPVDIEATYGDTLADVALHDGWSWKDSTLSVGNAGTQTFVAVFTPSDTNNYSTVEENITITVAKKEVAEPVASGSYTYTGNEHTVTLTGVESFMTVSGNKATNAGNYVVTVTLDNNHRWNSTSDGEIAWSIAKAAPSLEAPTAQNDITYGVLLSTVGLTEGWTWLNGTTIPSVQNSGFVACFTPADTANYDWTRIVGWNEVESRVEKTVSVTVTKADSSIAAAPTAILNLEYDGSAKALVNAGTANGGTMQYSLDGTTWSADIPAGTNANTYTVYYKVVGDANHDDNAGGSVSVTIGKADKTAPEVAGVDETIKSKADGRITGVDDTMEYKKQQGDENYIAITADTVENLAAGTYLVRYKETENYFASSDKQIVIADGVMFTIAFNSNEGTSVDSVTCEWNQTITAPTEPTKDGFEFISWYLDDTLTTKWTNEYQFTADTTLYAKWVQGTVSDHEDHVDEIEADGLNDVAKAEETDIKLVVQVEEATEGDSEQTAIKGIADAPNNFGFYDITLEKSSGGYVTNASSVIEIKLPYDFTRKTNIKVYRYHSGVSEELAQLDARATAPYVDVKCYVDKSNNCIYIYSSKFSTYAVAYDTVRTTRYTVKFDTNGGSSVSSATVTKNAKVAEPKTPEKDGYTFGGWYTDKEFAEKYDFESKVTKNFTLYAKWDKHDDEQSSTDTHNCPSLAFDDLDITKWYHFDTDYVIENGIFKGTTETTFEPDSAQTRAMMVTVLYRVEGEPAVNRSIPFADVDMGAYYANAVIWGQQNGIIKGYSETEFGPDDKITREQIAAIMHRYAQYKGYDVSVGENTNILSYDDFDSISEYAIPSMQWAVGSGLIKGKSESTLNPLDNATRAEIASILHRFIEANK